MLAFLSSAWSAVSGLFGGSSSRAILWLSIALGAALLLGWLFWSRASLKADVAEAQATIGTLQAAYDASHAALTALQDAHHRQEIALTAREAQINQLNAQASALRAKKAKAVSRDAEYAAWRRAGSPAALRELHQ